MDPKVKLNTEIQTNNLKNNFEKQQPRMVPKKVVIYPHYYSDTPEESLIVTEYEDVTSQHIPNSGSEGISHMVEDFSITEVLLYDPENRAKRRPNPQGRKPNSSKYPQKFSCSDCSRTFSQKFSRDRHRFLIHGDRSLQHKFTVNSRQYLNDPEGGTRIVSCKFTSKDTAQSQPDSSN